MSPPSAVEVWVDDRMVANLRREGLGLYFDEGERVIYKGTLGFGRPNKVEIRLKEAHARNFGIDEIFFR